ncbi:MAG: helix-hairpin-helix domain-containing protein [Cyclobacteriaceae bacterium]
MKLSWIIVAFCLVMIKTFGQEIQKENIDLEKLADDLFPAQDLDLNYSELYENLAQILSNPFDLNSVSEEQLRQIYILNESQLSEFFEYREAQGKFISILELQVIPEFDQPTIKKLSPFVTVEEDNKSNTPLLKRIITEDNNYLIMRHARTIEQKAGHRNDASASSRYAGSPDNLYTRFRIARTNDFSLGFTLEKDAGERFDWTATQLGFDYTSAHAQFLNKGRLKNIIVGDYQIQFGQGLVLGGGFGVGKSAEPITTIRRSNIGFIPYTSLSELGFFRGASASLEITKALSISSFASRVSKDGNTLQDSTGTTLSSIASSGLHRTASELINRKSLAEYNAGLVISYQKRSFDAGVILHHTQFNIPVKPRTRPYNQFAFNGSNNTNASMFINYSWQNHTFFTELAKTIGHGNAATIGMLTSLTSQFDLSLMYRRFDPDFYSFYSNAVAENSTPQNEHGYYMGWKYKFTPKYELAGYLDIFRFPWLRFRGYAPSHGSEWLVRFAITPNKQLTLFLQAREETKIRNYSTTTLFENGPGIKRNFWLNADYEVLPELSFKSRIQHSTYALNGSSSSGFAIIQDVNFQIKKLSISTRYALFDTDDYDNRQYVYERDVWLAYSFPFYSGVGIRSYILVQYPISRHLDVWLRWARTQYSDRNVIGSGSEAILGDTRNDVKLQFRLKL